MSSLFKKIETLAHKTKLTAPQIAKLSKETKNTILTSLAQSLLEKSAIIQKINRKDVIAAEKKKLSPALIDRLILNEKRIQDMAQGLRDVASLPDPVGEVTQSSRRPNGLLIQKVRIPLGVIGIVYESRPNVTIDAAGLCIKSGNAVILRGGSEAIHSNVFLGKLVRSALKAHGVSPDAVQVLDTPDRKAMEYLVKQTASIDLIIPRGGESLMKWMSEHSRIPVIKHDKGVCHVYVDEYANAEMAEKICLNAKVQRPGVCNALETILVHEKAASKFLPSLLNSFFKSGVEVRGDATVKSFDARVKKATAADWDTEYLDLIIAIKTVPTLGKAIEHIQKHGSLHTEVIVTDDERHAEEFLNRLDSSMVAWNASTRFNDGGQLGLGAEIGISTTKMHAFGPMGLQELTTTKYVVKGNGQIRE